MTVAQRERDSIYEIVQPLATNLYTKQTSKYQFNEKKMSPIQVLRQTRKKMVWNERREKALMRKVSVLKMSAKVTTTKDKKADCNNNNSNNH